MKVAFYKGRKRLFNKLTSWWLRGPYSHCELILEDSEFGSLCASSSFMDGGVRVKVIALDPEHWDVIDVDGDAAFARQWLNDHAGEGYDTLGLIGFIARVIKQDKRRWFCSEAVAAMLQIPDPWRFDPCNLHAALTRPAHAGFFASGGADEQHS